MQRDTSLCHAAGMACSAPHPLVHKAGMPRGILPFTSAGDCVPGTWLQLNAGRRADRLRHCSPVGLLILLRIYPDISDGVVISA
jgi:hypothetical protein